MVRLVSSIAIVRIAGAIALLSFTALAPLASAQDRIGDIQKGAVMAQRVCAECHAVREGQDRSPNPKAPSFAHVAIDPSMTSLALHVWFQTPHPTMPDFVLKADEMDDLAAYIQSLKGRN